MTEIRPLQHADLPRVADLLATMFPVWTAHVWQQFLRATLLENPWTDEDLPSLVSWNDAGAITGFIGSNVRRVTFDEAPIRVACSSHLAVEPGSRGTAAGAFLLRRLLQGGQDATITDSASPEVRGVWESLGGRLEPLRSMQWMQVLRPGAWLARLGLAVPRRRGDARVLLPVTALPLRTLARRGRALATSPGDDELLDPSALISNLDAVAPRVRVRPLYDMDYLAWLLEELASMSGPGGTVLRGLVRHGGRVLGWYVCDVQRSGVGRVLQVMCRPEDAERVLAQLFRGAASRGAVVLTGRVEPHLAEGLRHHDCVVGAGKRHLVHARDPDLLAALGCSSLFTLLDGEWW